MTSTAVQTIADQERREAVRSLTDLAKAEMTRANGNLAAASEAMNQRLRDDEDLRMALIWVALEALAVIDGEGRQHKVANAEGALIHGYSPERRSVVWVMADSMAKLQRTWFDKETGEVRKPAGPYGEVLEAEKAKALEKGLSKTHAENRAKRHMSKRILRDMTVEWRRAVGQSPAETQKPQADSATFPMAAE